MAVSGAVAFTLDVTQICDEAWERCGVDKQMLTGDHQVSARRSLNLLFARWSNLSSLPWQMVKTSLTLTAGDADITLPTGTIDVINAVLRRSGTDIDMIPISRTDYDSIPNKATTGRPDRYFIDKQATPVMYLWQSPENSTDTLEYWRLTQADDVTLAVENVDTPTRWLDAVCAELSYRLYMKRPDDQINPLRLSEIKGERKESYDAASIGDRDRSDSVIIPGGF